MESLHISKGIRNLRIYKGILLTIIVTILISSSAFAKGGGIPTYRIYPAVQDINLNQSLQISISLSGGQANTLIDFTVTVTKPDRTSTATAQYTLVTNDSGSAMGTLSYPTSFSNGSASRATDQTGAYQIRVDQNLPSFRYGVASSSFGVTSTLFISIVSPTAGTTYQRGSNVSIAALVTDVNGNPYSLANVSASVPGQESMIPLLPNSQPGSYSASYSVKWSDPTGLWTINYLAADTSGNRGEVLLSTNITSSPVILRQITILDATDLPRSSFYDNETVKFQIAAAYPDASPVTSGAASIRLIDPTGRIVITLAAVYVPTLNRYVTVTGYRFTPTSDSGSWTAIVSTNALDDGFGNRGPTTPVSIQFQVTSLPGSTGSNQITPMSYGEASFLPVAALGIGAVVPVVAWKRKERNQFSDIDLLVRLSQSAGFTLVEGEKQTGKSTALYRAIERRAQEKNRSLLLTFELPPGQVRTRMSQLGIDAGNLEEDGTLRIIDCSNVSQSIDLDFIRSELLKAIDGTGQSFAVFIDSLNLLFDDLDEVEVEGLLTGLFADLKQRRGELYATLTYNPNPQLLRSTLESRSGLLLQAEGNSQTKDGITILKVMKARKGVNVQVGRRLTIS